MTRLLTARVQVSLDQFKNTLEAIESFHSGVLLEKNVSNYVLFAANIIGVVCFQRLFYIRDFMFLSLILKIC